MGFLVLSNHKWLKMTKSFCSFLGSGQGISVQARAYDCFKHVCPTSLVFVTPLVGKNSVYTHVYIHTHMYICTDTCIHIYTIICTQTHINTPACTHAHIHMSICISCTHINLCIVSLLSINTY